MIIHKVRNPFYCRQGQFTEGVQELCIGLDLHAIESTDKFKCYIGKNDLVVYEINSAEALRTGQSWRNPKGKIVLIVPLSIAKVSKNEEWIPIENVNPDQSVSLTEALVEFSKTQSEAWEALRIKLHSKK